MATFQDSPRESFLCPTVISPEQGMKIFEHLNVLALLIFPLESPQSLSCTAPTKKRAARQGGHFNIDLLFHEYKATEPPLHRHLRVQEKPPVAETQIQKREREEDWVNNLPAAEGDHWNQRPIIEPKPLTLRQKLSFIGDLPLVSPFTTRQLPTYIRRDSFVDCTRIKLNQQLQKEFYFTGSLDFSYIREKHFWPGIDVREYLKFPDFTIVVSYKELVVGCGLMTPDAYISYIFLHPDWRLPGIASFVLYHLIQTCPGKDVTLHVSATNPAMIFYQSFGFKPEQYIVDFYDKYLPDDSETAKDGFYLRLRR